MKKLLFIAVAMCLAACSGTNDPTSYTLIKQMKDGSEQKEQFNAESDSAAMMHLLDVGMKDQGKTIVRGTLLNYKGDTISTEKNASKMMEKTFGVSTEKIDSTLQLADSVLEILESI